MNARRGVWQAPRHPAARGTDFRRYNLTRKALLERDVFQDITSRDGNTFRVYSTLPGIVPTEQTTRYLIVSIERNQFSGTRSFPYEIGGPYRNIYGR